MTLPLKHLGGCVILLVSGVGTVLTVGLPTRNWLHVGTFVVEFASLCLAWAAAFYYNSLFEIRLFDTFARFARRVLRTCLLASAIFLVLLLLFQALSPPCCPTLQPFLVTLLLMLLLLLPIRPATHAMLRRGVFGERVIVFGDGPERAQLVEEMSKRPDLYHMVVTVAAEPAPPEGGHASYEGLERAIQAYQPHGIVLALSDRRKRLPVEYLVQARLRGIRVENASDVYERLMQKLALEHLTPSSFLFSRALHKSTLYLGMHRVLSAMFAALGLVVSAPLMALIAVVVKLDSPGPVFFRQKRVGWRDRVFVLYKFRTMKHREPGGSESTWQRDNATRVTRIGRWLRRTRLDELPQLWNILRGDMSFIGPRPEMAENVEVMVREIPFFRLRHIVRPGITGWAQVKNGYALSRESVLEKIRCDLYYIKHMGVALDLTILLESVRVILFEGHGDANV